MYPHGHIIIRSVCKSENHVLCVCPHMCVRMDIYAHTHKNMWIWFLRYPHLTCVLDFEN